MKTGVSVEMEKEVGGLDALEKSGLTQVKCTHSGQMEVLIPGERGICSGGGHSGLALDPGKGKERSSLFLSIEDVAPTPRLRTQAPVAMWPL